MGLKVEHVNKTYGTKKVVNNISFEIDKPSVYGLLGTNGAGKTTTIRMILGILKKDSGEISWNGKEVKRKNVNFGYLPEERGVYPKTKIYDQMMYFAELKGMKKEKAIEALKYWAKRLEVEQYINMTPEKLSKGNQQKIQFITSIIHNPELVVLDEPFSGLDPVNTEILKSVIIELIKNGKYIIIKFTNLWTNCDNVTGENRFDDPTAGLPEFSAFRALRSEQRQLGSARAAALFFCRVPAAGGVHGGAAHHRAPAFPAPCAAARADRFFGRSVPPPARLLPLFRASLPADLSGGGRRAPRVRPRGLRPLPAPGGALVHPVLPLLLAGAGLGRALLGVGPLQPAQRGIYRAAGSLHLPAHLRQLRRIPEDHPLFDPEPRQHAALRGNDKGRRGAWA